MHPRAAEFTDRAAREYGLDLAVEEFPEGTKTAAAAAEAVDCDVAQITNSLVFVVDDDPVIALTSGANRVDEGKLAARFDVDADGVAMADAETVKSATGWSIGGVPPFCHATELPLLVDPTLTDYEYIWAAAGTPSTVFRLTPATLLETTDGVVADVTE